MRIVIDLQAAQAENRKRGIGRYSFALASAIVRNRGEHEVLIALNALFPSTIDPIRAAFDGILPRENIRVWNAVSPVAKSDTSNDWRRQSSELIREAFLGSLKPDMVLVTSLFEGLGADAVTSIGKLSHNIPTAVILYDLIPLVHHETYLKNPVVKAWYLEKIEHLRRADLWLAISESSRHEGIEHLRLPNDLSVNISTDADQHFQVQNISARAEQELRQKYGLNSPFVMYTGGIDHRKNIEGLIRAFSMLSEPIRDGHQLAIICSVQPESRVKLKQLAEKLGLVNNKVVLTGFVPEDDLVSLYNLCKLFVFPSWHEGFGLPALEAIRCGAPVIGANTSSLPEVIGLKEALFDPYSDQEMAKAIEHALSADKFRNELIRHGRKQSKKFSWDASARCAISAMTRRITEYYGNPSMGEQVTKKPKLAYISPLPPERSGIADYSAELLPELSRFYQIDVIIAQEKVSNPWINANCSAHSVQWFVDNAHDYDRILYHFGNSAFHQHMFELLNIIPGVVVLHDFFLSGVIAHMDVHGRSPGSWGRALYYSHGYLALSDRFHANDTADVVWAYPCSLNVIQRSLGIIAHSENSLSLVQQWFGGEAHDWAIIPLMRNPQINSQKSIARNKLGFDPGDFLICAFGVIGPTKLNERLLRAWLKSSAAKSRNCHLVFVGDNPSSEYSRELLKAIRLSKLKAQIHITGWVEPSIFNFYLAAADIGVQLRTLSRGETSAAVLDCMNFGLATIVNANGSMADLPNDSIWKLPDDFIDEQLINALETLWKDEGCRLRIGDNARKTILRDHSPRSCSEKYRQAIERFYRQTTYGLPRLPEAIADIPGRLTDDAELINLADAVARSFPEKHTKRQLLVDVSELAQRDAKSGIQRVVRSVLKEWLSHPPAGYRVEPVYATVDRGYHYARNFTLGFLECPRDMLQDEPIDYTQGDVFLGLDLQPQVVTKHRAFYQTMRIQGVKVYFVVYDLLCILMPQHFVSGAKSGFTRWLEVVTEADGAICISKAVADELTSWVKEFHPLRQQSFVIKWFHLGADYDKYTTSKELPEDANTLLGCLRLDASFLMVGTLEPRKGHDQVLSAFDLLWAHGLNIKLVIVGNQGWMVEDLVERINAHPKLGKNLFWLKGVNDEYLDHIYSACTCLIAASYGEGFGLPLIESAQHDLPVIARDIPVFREVGGGNAYYFDTKVPDDLAKGIQDWLALFKRGAHPKPNNISWIAWKESARKLLGLLIPVDSTKAR